MSSISCAWTDSPSDKCSTSSCSIGQVLSYYWHVILPCSITCVNCIMDQSCDKVTNHCRQVYSSVSSNTEDGWFAMNFLPVWRTLVRRKWYLQLEIQSPSHVHCPVAGWAPSDVFPQVLPIQSTFPLLIHLLSWKSRTSLQSSLANSGLSFRL